MQVKRGGLKFDICSIGAPLPVLSILPPEIEWEWEPICTEVEPRKEKSLPLMVEESAVPLILWVWEPALLALILLNTWALVVPANAAAYAVPPAVPSEIAFL